MRSKQITFDGSTRNLRVENVQVPAPESDSVIARVTMAGVCGTDAHRLSGDVPAEPGPISFGHEAVGVVAEAGAEAVDWRGMPLTEGDRIVWFPPSAGCGECAQCRDQMWVLCRDEHWPYPATRPNPAGFQEYATLSPRVPVYRCEPATSDRAYAAFGCALPTAFEGLDAVGGIKSTDTVVVQGAGPVGLAYAALVARAEPTQLIVIGAPSSRLAWARAFGATTTFDVSQTTQEQRLEAVRALTGGHGVDVVLEATGVAEAFPEGISLLARRGRYQITGLFSGARTVPVDPVLINNNLLTIRGAYGGLPIHRERAVEIVPELERRFGISRLVEATFPLAETELAISQLGSGGAIKTAVIP